MTADLVRRLEQGFENLVEALDGQDPDLIIKAASDIQPLIAEMKKTGVWYENSDLQNRFLILSKRIEAARFRVNKLTNLNQQRAINLSHALGSGVFPTYGKRR
tara:strand:+ start:1185 stop:1493 length:309 start_codon:yes stop_codon:yes gene_type:complete